MQQPTEQPATKAPLVRYLDETAPIDCPYGHVRRVVTGGEGGVANVHVVEVTRGGLHLHRAYDETYFVLEGHGTMVLGGATHRLRPGAVVVIPPEVPHSLEADEGEVLRFVIFGTPAMSIDDPRAAPTRPS
ncbi:MAG: cupin domain-containing protein [Myxococcales bacterium]|nr:cupin domain-containing protein [Myxococcales bacterium]MCB9538131.1 cupin domain-containing protein [Myxococcales bacterium]